MSSNLVIRWEAFCRRNDCVEIYPRRLTGLRKLLMTCVYRYAPHFQRRYWQWLESEILWNERTVEYVTVARMLPPPPCRVLDVGSASSRWPFQLASIGYRVTALDVRPLGFEHPNVEPICASLFDWSPPFAFEVVTAISVVEHLGLGRYGDQVLAQGDMAAMRILRTWLAKDGVLILSVPFGLEGITSKHRIYDAAALERLCQGYVTVEDRYFKRHDEAWLPCQARDLAQVPSPHLPVNGVVVRKLGQ